MSGSLFPLQSVGSMWLFLFMFPLWLMFPSLSSPTCFIWTFDLSPAMNHHSVGWAIPASDQRLHLHSRARPPLGALSADSWRLLHLYSPCKSTEQPERGLISVTLLPLTCYYSVFFLSLPALMVGLRHTPVASKREAFVSQQSSPFLFLNVDKASCIETFISMSLGQAEQKGSWCQGTYLEAIKWTKAKMYFISYRFF